MVMILFLLVARPSSRLRVQVFSFVPTRLERMRVRERESASEHEVVERTRRVYDGWCPQMHMAICNSYVQRPT